MVAAAPETGAAPVAADAHVAVVAAAADHGCIGRVLASPLVLGGGHTWGAVGHGCHTRGSPPCLRWARPAAERTAPGRSGTVRRQKCPLCSRRVSARRPAAAQSGESADGVPCLAVTCNTSVANSIPVSATTPSEALMPAVALTEPDTRQRGRNALDSSASCAHPSLPLTSV
eukprot:scaffold1135_cov343-Prasinococcus_capsulatus_cf.AAC.16